MPRTGNTAADEAAIRAALGARLAAAQAALGHAMADLARGAQGAQAAFQRATGEVEFWTQVVARAAANGAFDGVPDDVRGLGAGRPFPPPPPENP